MESKVQRKKRTTFLAAGIFFLLTALMVIPPTSQAIFGFLGIEQDSGKTVYNGFEPFVPYVPGYFPDDFDLVYVNDEAEHITNADTYIDTYMETYASADHFFKLVESKGPSLPDQVLDPDLTIQEQPASLTGGFDPTLFEDKNFDISTYDTSDVQIVTVVLKDIYIQVVTNLPQEEAVRVADGLVPAICTTKPTQPAN